MPATPAFDAEYGACPIAAAERVLAQEADGKKA
jgi:hypothetical protein